MRRIRIGNLVDFNGVGTLSRLAGVVRLWGYPAAFFALWLAALLFTVSRLETVGPNLRAIPDARALTK